MIRSLIIYLLSASLSYLTACRLWAVCTKSGYVLSSLPSTEKMLIIEELNGLYNQSQSMLNGWGLLSYDSIPEQSTSSIYRSSITAYSDSANYWNNAFALVDSGKNRIGICHLRLASSGANNIPNPHPWIFNQNEVLYSLIHNGTISKVKLYNLITDYGSDLSWLNQNNPNTFSENSWTSDEGWASVVDSELLLLYIMQQIIKMDSLIEGLEFALTQLLNEGVYANQINIIFSNGNDLYVFGGENSLFIMESSKYISVMTQPVSYSQDLNLYWSGIEDKELVKINAGGISRFPDFIHQSISDEPIITLSSFGLKPAFPNPFNNEITIPFDIGLNDNASLSIFSLMGEEIFSTSLNQDQLQKGYIKWSATNHFKNILPSGTYFIQLKTEIISDMHKILFIK